MGLIPEDCRGVAGARHCCALSRVLHLPEKGCISGVLKKEQRRQSADVLVLISELVNSYSRQFILTYDTAFIWAKANKGK
ncbi:MAG: hypothetical protein RMX96_24185 [Nostoc sp. ChiSLP02]|nr:hypothetical protein [Nostoc sp. DedSLP05]MDZ8101157.1 hypothetical protein [Nostoc sp. DedSLP01]MDZ8187936.1 hypothetical protein [Nostoc sp. ChiSLP02]